MTGFLKNGFSPADLKALSIEELGLLSEEIRRLIISVVTRNGGHLASSLGAVELIVALHRVFDCPTDRIVFDVGHQSYAHKILTGRFSEFGTLRREGGLSGFPRREESPADAFNAGHSSTSISAALGMAVARDLEGKKHKVVAVIGDGALTGGMAMEALNHVGGLQKDLLVILNDNKWSIGPNVGALSQYLSLKLTTPGHLSIRETVKSTIRKVLPKRGTKVIRRLQKAEETLKSMLASPGNFLAAWGFKYLGPIEGHDVGKLVEALEHVKLLDRPVFLHVLTVKGKGHGPAEIDPSGFHGLGTGKVPRRKEPPATAATLSELEDTSTPRPPRAETAGEPKTKMPLSHTDAFGALMVREGEKNPKLAAITAAMSRGTGLSEFFRRFPERSFDAGIAEPHAVTMAAAMASRGFRPVVAIYSTFLQRAFDQLYHDVALQKLPVLFAVDRAGLVGEDGPTHHGALDLSYLRLLPGFAVMAPRDDRELRAMFESVLALENPGPAAIRYPRGPAFDFDDASPRTPIVSGKGELLREGDDLAIVAAGPPATLAAEAADILLKDGIRASVINVRFLKPLDEELILRESQKSGRVLTIEDNVLLGGLKGAVSELLLEKGRGPFKLLSLGLPDAPVPHATQARQRARAGLETGEIAKKCRELTGFAVRARRDEPDNPEAGENGGNHTKAGAANPGSIPGPSVEKGAPRGIFET
ncbi:MAG: 1-deoxy-D-xylulose-5-phosphate synthase [Deltaproteobacteria bacterium]|jgi:1-deoxy-D-xylulose-5-phosphate synthase|nr:1-deoxy-D-xylulose-5-phosphate synthase [Deltaproteobacteria bacterium]